MKTSLALFAILIAASCASSSSDDTAASKNDRVAIQLVQLVGPTNVQSQGAFDVQYGITVRNLTNEPVTIKRVEINQVGGGPYVLRRGPANSSFAFAKQVPPGSDASVAVWMHAYQRVLPGEVRSFEPINLRTRVDFDSPRGKFGKTFNTVVPQSNE